MSGAAANPWLELVEQLRAAGGGLFDLHVVRWAGMRRLRAAALAGNAEAADLFRVAGDALRCIADSPVTESKECAACSAALPPRHFAIAIARPATAYPQQSVAMALAVCSRCDATPGAIGAAATAVLNLGLPSARADRATHLRGDNT